MIYDIDEYTNVDSYADKLEYVYREYERSLDLDIAFAITPLGEDEREKLRSDPVLLARCTLCDARVRHDLITDLRKLSTSAINEGVRFNALKELGKTLYPKRFKDVITDNNNTPRRILYEVIERVESSD